VAWGDFDNDGRLTSCSRRRIFPTVAEHGSGFSNVTASLAPGLPGVFQKFRAWGDFDNDGRLDFLITGTTNGSVSGTVSQLWRNTGSGFSKRDRQSRARPAGVLFTSGRGAF